MTDIVHSTLQGPSQMELPPISHHVLIDAPLSDVWRNLTDAKLMQLWMAGPEMNIAIESNWDIGSPFTISGWLHGTSFKNTGTITSLDFQQRFAFTHLSSLSNLPEKEENFCTLEFALAGKESATSITLTISNFPTESIYRHMNFYWNMALQCLKRQTEQVSDYTTT